MQTNKINTRRFIALGTLSAMTLGTMAVSTPAQAKSDTWKKVAIGAGIVTGYGLLKDNKKVAIIGGLATAGSYYMYRKDKKKEDQQNQWWRNRDTYNRYPRR